MKIIIEVAGDVDTFEAMRFLNALQLDILEQDVFKHIIKDVKVTK